ncbi:unnamed protein product [Amoebophrya sp. A120]|nr:unnamed protein product [Amoebophrya sp. A120]|eukprot:GSA120T00011482001.1
MPTPYFKFTRFWQTIDPVIANVQIPKEVRIENRRLGTLYLFLMLGASTWVLYNFIYSKAWNMEETPVPGIIELWSQLPSNLTGNSANEKHCADMNYYAYDWSSTWTYRAEKCMILPPGENVHKMGNKMYIPTYVQDSYQVGGSTNWTLNYFAQNVDEMFIYFNHGYEVHDKDEVNRGRDKFQATKGIVGEQAETIHGEKGQLLTIIQDEGGKRECIVSGKSHWYPKDTKNGINGKLREWLACGGVSLDSVNNDVKSGSPEETGIPTFRMSGLKLHFDLTYHNTYGGSWETHREKDWEGVVCYIRVRVGPMWNSNQYASHTVVYNGVYPNTNDPAKADPQSAYRYRYQYGVGLEIQAAGAFAFLDYQALITGLVNALVLLALPTLVVKFVALYLVGPSSTVYANVQREPLDFNTAIYGSCARKIIAMQTFKQLLQQHGATEEGLTKEHLRNMLLKAMHQCVVDGKLDEEAIGLIAEAMLQGMDQDGDALIELNEFVETCSVGENVTSTEMGRLFDRKRQPGYLESLLTDSKMKAMLAHAQGKGAGESIYAKKKRSSRSRGSSPGGGSARSSSPPAAGKAAILAEGEEALRATAVPYPSEGFDTAHELEFADVVSSRG